MGATIASGPRHEVFQGDIMDSPYSTHLKTAHLEFWDCVEQGPDCWKWLGKFNPRGYPIYFRYKQPPQRAHRVAYERTRGPIPKGLTLDHLCRNRGCVNPSHMEPVSQRENTLRGNTPAARHAAKTHCKNGHEFNDTDTYIRIRNNRPTRVCRPCTRVAWRKHHQYE